MRALHVLARPRPTHPGMTNAMIEDALVYGGIDTLILNWSNSKCMGSTLPPSGFLSKGQIDDIIRQYGSAVRIGIVFPWERPLISHGGRSRLPAAHRFTHKGRQYDNVGCISSHQFVEDQFREALAFGKGKPNVGVGFDSEHYVMNHISGGIPYLDRWGRYSCHCARCSALTRDKSLNAFQNLLAQNMHKANWRFEMTYGNLYLQNVKKHMFYLSQHTYTGDRRGKMMRKTKRLQAAGVNVTAVPGMFCEGNSRRNALRLAEKYIDKYHHIWVYNEWGPSRYRKRYKLDRKFWKDFGAVTR